MNAAAAKLIADGFAVVPIVPGKKNPNDPDWLKKTYAPGDFVDGCNIGVKCGKPSGHRVDIDMDAPEAVAIGQQLLYNTNLIHGRPGKPSSHWWYTCPGAVTKSYKDINGEVLIEIRADGGQTVVPPSTHKSGDVLAWEQSGAAATIAFEDVVHTVRGTAVAALFARHWPKGSRHVAAGHLSGFLLRLGYDDTWVQQIIEHAAKAAGDEEIKDRVRIAKDTCAKHKKGEKTTGGPKLAECFEHGLKLAERVYDWFDRPGDDLLDLLNEKHFVSRIGAGMVVGTESTHEPISFQSFEKFREVYYNRTVGKLKLGEWWLQHPGRRTFERVVFAPPPLPSSPQDYNLWKGFAVAPDKGSRPEERCPLFLNHLLRVICDGDKIHYFFLLDVCALTCQYPGRPSGIAVALRGPQGAGKGTFVEQFGSLFGDHFIQIDKAEQLVGEKNAHLSGKVVVFADEAVWGGNKQQVGALRRMVTERTLTVRALYRDAHSQANCVHLFMATNEDWMWPTGLKERRGFILDVPEKIFTKEDPNYFDAIRAEWANGGAEAFLAVCLQRQLKSLFLKIPATSGLIEQQKLSMDPITSWWLSVLMEGCFGRMDEWPEFMDNIALYDAFIEATRQSEGGGRRGTSVLLTQRLKGLLPTGARMDRRQVKVNVNPGFGQHVLVSQQRRGWVIPPLDLCRKKFNEVAGIDYPWPDMHDAPPVLEEVASEPL